MYSMARRLQEPTRNYARRGVFIDWLGRFVWYRDSLGKKSRAFPILDDERADDVANMVQRVLDELDPIPASAFVPPPLTGRHLQLL